MMTTVKLLSNDEVAEIEARANAATEGPWGHQETPSSSEVLQWYEVGPQLYEPVAEVTNDVFSNFYENAVFIAHAREDIPALCATVRVLRATHSCGAVEGNTVVGGCGSHVLVVDGFRCADCLAWFHRDCINEHFKLDAYVKKLRELREQGAIDDWKKELAAKETENTALREQLAEAQQLAETRSDIIAAKAAHVDQLQSQLTEHSTSNLLRRLKDFLFDNCNHSERDRNYDWCPTCVMAFMDVVAQPSNTELQSQLAQVTAERARGRFSRSCTHPNTYPLTATSRRCHDCGLEVLL